MSSRPKGKKRKSKISSRACAAHCSGTDKGIGLNNDFPRRKGEQPSLPAVLRGFPPRGRGSNTRAWASITHTGEREGRIFIDFGLRRGKKTSHKLLYLPIAARREQGETSSLYDLHRKTPLSAIRREEKRGERTRVKKLFRPSRT